MKKLEFLMLDLKSYYNSPAYQLGLLVAYACTEEVVKERINFRFSEHPRPQPAQEIAEKILDLQVDVVAMSNYSWNYKKICGILDYLTSCGRPLPYIIIGGPNSAGSFGEDMMKEYPIISVMIEGEGEPAFKDICLSLATDPDKDPFMDSRNCVVRSDNGAISRPNINHRIKMLDEVPSPYLEGIIPLHPAPLFYETNRGCPYRCTFCYWGNGNSKVYRMSQERITEEIEFFAKNKVRAMFLADANFGIFPGDADIARLICEANARYNYPIRFVGVNWAKNSSDRILEIASIFREGKIGVATTLAIQSVSQQAEEISKRYAMPPSRFVNLVKNAEERNIDTYTDLIWGLPGESYPEFLQGLEAVISTGVPSLMIHQLSLLPGTELYESKEELKIRLLSEERPETVIPHEERSDYYEYIVISHQNMSYTEMKRGARILGVAHVLHNHDLGKIVNFYLARYGLGVKEAFSFLDDLLMGKVDDFPSRHRTFLDKMRQAIVGFADGTGNDETIFYRRLSEHIWFKPSDNGFREVRQGELRDFMQDFYKAFCEKYQICTRAKEQQWLQALVDYNWLISPKPVWKPNASYELSLDVHAIWADMLAVIYSHAIPEAVAKKQRKNNPEDNWEKLPGLIREKLANLLSEEYLESKEKTVSYQVKNPWVFPPSKTNIDWLLTARSKHCQVVLQE
ncbi:MAG: radical SAM protein [Bacteroidota bacterium]